MPETIKAPSYGFITSRQSSDHKSLYVYLGDKKRRIGTLWIDEDGSLMFDYLVEHNTDGSDRLIVPE